MSVAPIVYLVGTHHGYQIEASDFISTDKEVASLFPHLGIPSQNSSDEFRNFITEQIEKFGILRIGEEMNSEGLKKWQRRPAPSVAYKVADHFGLRHQYCDPHQSVRDEMKTKNPNMALAEIKERYWIGQLLNFEEFPALFIAGAEHVTGARFVSLLTNSGFKAIVLVEDWKPRML